MKCHRCNRELFSMWKDEKGGTLVEIRDEQPVCSYCAVTYDDLKFAEVEKNRTLQKLGKPSMRINVVNKRTFKGKGIPIHRASPKETVPGSPLGNPFYLKDVNDAEERDKVINQYEQWLDQNIQENNTEVVDELVRLYNIAEIEEELNLICFCAPKRCHGDIIKKILLEMEKEAEELPPREKLKELFRN